MQASSLSGQAQSASVQTPTGTKGITTNLGFEDSTKQLAITEQMQPQSSAMTSNANGETIGSGVQNGTKVNENSTEASAKASITPESEVPQILSMTIQDLQKSAGENYLEEPPEKRCRTDFDETWINEYNEAANNVSAGVQMMKEHNEKNWSFILKLKAELKNANAMISELKNTHVLEKQDLETKMQQLMDENLELTKNSKNCFHCGAKVPIVSFCSSDCQDNFVR